MTHAIGVEERTPRFFLVSVELFEVGEVIARKRVGVAQHLDDVVILHHRPEAVAPIRLVIPVHRLVLTQFGEEFPRSAVIKKVEVGE